MTDICTITHVISTLLLTKTISPVNKLFSNTENDHSASLTLVKLSRSYVRKQIVLCIFVKNTSRGQTLRLIFVHDGEGEVRNTKINI